MPERETVRLLTAGGGAGGGRSGDGRLPVAVLSPGERSTPGRWRPWSGRRQLAPGTAVPGGGAVAVRHPDGDVRHPGWTGCGSCHFGYFMQYGLRAKERRPAGFEAPEIGTFLHYLLENVAP